MPIHFAFGGGPLGGFFFNYNLAGPVQNGREHHNNNNNNNIPQPPQNPNFNRAPGGANDPNAEFEHNNPALSQLLVCAVFMSLSGALFSAPWLMAVLGATFVSILFMGDQRREWAEINVIPMLQFLVTLVMFARWDLLFNFFFDEDEEITDSPHVSTGGESPNAHTERQRQDMEAEPGNEQTGFYEDMHRTVNNIQLFFATFLFVIFVCAQFWGPIYQFIGTQLHNHVSPAASIRWRNFITVMGMQPGMNARRGAPVATDRDTLANLPAADLSERAFIRAGGPVLCCAVCLENFKLNETGVVELPCKHMFHRTPCVDEWLKGHNTCPTCRHELPGETRPHTHTDNMSLPPFLSHLRHVLVEKARQLEEWWRQPHSVRILLAKVKSSFEESVLEFRHMFTEGTLLPFVAHQMVLGYTQLCESLSSLGAHERLAHARAALVNLVGAPAVDQVTEVYMRIYIWGIGILKPALERLRLFLEKHGWWEPLPVPETDEPASDDDSDSGMLPRSARAARARIAASWPLNVLFPSRNSSPRARTGTARTTRDGTTSRGTRTTRTGTSNVPRSTTTHVPATHHPPVSWGGSFIRSSVRARVAARRMWSSAVGGNHANTRTGNDIAETSGSGYAESNGSIDQSSQTRASAAVNRLLDSTTMGNEILSVSFEYARISSFSRSEKV